MINAVICEFNPFHNGHKYLIERAKEKTGADATVCIMSGNFVQRGEPSLWDKHTRAAAAVKGGADLVLQLPTAHTLASAGVFADSGVCIADSLGVETALCFGSESEDITELYRLALVDRKKLDAHFKTAIAGGMSYAAAAQTAYEKCGMNGQLLKSPNNLLAFEYIKSVINRKSDIKVINIQRVGADHDGQETDGAFASATYIREHLSEDMSRFAPFVLPPRLDTRRFEQLALFSIYTKTAQELSRFADMNEGLENKFFEVSRTAKSLEELYEGVKSKRYTAARIRRTAINAVLQNPKGLCKSEPDCLRVLAFNDKGRELLRILENSARLPVITKPADCKALDSQHFELECRASDLFDFCCFNRKGGGSEYKNSPIYIK